LRVELVELEVSSQSSRARRAVLFD